MNQYAIQYKINWDSGEHGDVIALFLAEPDGVTITTSPAVADIDTYVESFRSESIQEALKKGESGLMIYFNGGYKMADVDEFSGPGRHAYEDALDEFVEKHPDAVKRFVSAG